jgi:RNA polymerase sigma-70 factor (ECF subfamily)
MNSTSTSRESASSASNEESLVTPKSRAPGKREAWEFAAQRRDWLCAQARNVCRNGSDAEDLVQETLLKFLRAFEKLESLPSSKICEAWLVTTLTHLFYEQCRKRKVEARGAAEPSLSHEAVIEQEPVSQLVCETITDEQFAQALQALSPKLRATFELHAAGKKYRDIARMLGIQMGTVAKRLHDARARLHALLLPHSGAGPH